MTLSIICTGKDPEPWVNALKQVDDSLDIEVWPNERDKKAVDFALCWQHPNGILRDYPNLRCISSMGAGIDHFFNDTFFPKQLPVVRLVDPLLAKSMFEYIGTAVMFYFRELDIYQSQQQQKRWYQQMPKSKADTTVGVLGLGHLGAYAGHELALMGFNVIGWSRAAKTVADVKTYAGDDQLNAFLAQTDVLICLLPLTEQTRGILNRKLFNALPKGAYLINVARGDHLVEEDLIEALADGQLKGACLDVFCQEPLPENHPFWHHQKIRVTPHISSITDPRSVAPQIAENYRRMKSGQPLLHQVDFLRGY